MEVYSIITDIEQIDITSQGALTLQAFNRNKYLLRRYSSEFKNINEMEFRSKVRQVLKQVRLLNKKEVYQRFSSKEFDARSKSKENFQLEPLKLVNGHSPNNSSLGSIPRLTIFKSIQNLQKFKQTQRPAIKPTKRPSLQVESWKIKKVSLGQDLQTHDQKLQCHLNNRYKSMLARLKNWYYSPKSLSSLSSKPSYYFNSTLASYINKKNNKC